MTSKPLVRRTLATLRSAEFGFFGVVVYTRVQTPRFCGFCSIAGTFDLAFCGSRPLRISWLIVGMKPFTLCLREVPAVTLLNRKSAEPKQHHCRLATRMLSNVQLLPGASESTGRSDGRAHSDGAVKGQPQ